MLTIGIGVSYLAVVVITSGWFYAQMQSEFPTLAVADRRSDVSRSIALGLFFGLTLPLGLVLSFLLTNCAQHGWWKSYKD